MDQPAMTYLAKQFPETAYLLSQARKKFPAPPNFGALNDSPVVRRAATLDPHQVAFTRSQDHVRTVLADLQAEVMYLGAALQAVLNEVEGGKRPYSAESYLPPEFVEILRGALGYPLDLETRS